MFNEERDIIDHFQICVERSNVLFLPKTKNTVNIYEIIHNKKKWLQWIDNSAKDVPPPDFYSDKYSLMLEIMRVDDHSYKNEKGKWRNPTLERESDMCNELKEKGIIDTFPQAKIICNAVTNLLTNEDHNYDFYLNNFIHTVNKHKNNVDNYKKNHPNHELIFFLADESTAYIESKENRDVDSDRMVGDSFFGEPQLFFYDESFINIIKESRADYFIWYAPYKHIYTLEKDLCLPVVVIYDVKNMNFQTIQYEREIMVSSEI